MDHEVDIKISQLAERDSFYQNLLQQCQALAIDYVRIQKSLSQEDQEILEHYIALCEELEYQRSRMAYAIGTQDGVRTGTAILTAD